MEAVQGLLSSFWGQGSGLQRQGPITKEQLMQFFTHGKELFADSNLKLQLSMAAKQNANLQPIVDGAQAQVWEQKVEPPVQGAYGLTSLSKVRTAYAGDSEVLKAFYEFVHLEEKLLDEAEMTPEAFEKKYANIYAMKKAMEAKMEEHKVALEGLSEAEKEKYMSQVFKAMVDQSGGCGNGACSSCPPQMPDLPNLPTTVPPAMIEALAAHPMHGPGANGHPGAGLPTIEGGRVQMSEEEQLAFFQKMQRS